MHDAAQFVYVNQDGSVRELTPDERQYLSEDFHGADSARPYIKSSYKSASGWGSISGFLPRRKVPTHIVVEPANEKYSPANGNALQEWIEDAKRVGDIVTEASNGSVTFTPNPRVSRRERFELARQVHLDRQLARENLAKHPAYPPIQRESRARATPSWGDRLFDLLVAALDVLSAMLSFLRRLAAPRRGRDNAKR